MAFYLNLGHYFKMDLSCFIRLHEQSQSILVFSLWKTPVNSQSNTLLRMDLKINLWAVFEWLWFKTSFEKDHFIVDFTVLISVNMAIIHFSSSFLFFLDGIWTPRFSGRPFQPNNTEFYCISNLFEKTPWYWLQTPLESVKGKNDLSFLLI